MAAWPNEPDRARARRGRSAGRRCGRSPRRAARPPRRSRSRPAPGAGGARRRAAASAGPARRAVDQRRAQRPARQIGEPARKHAGHRVRVRPRQRDRPGQNRGPSRRRRTPPARRAELADGDPAPARERQAQQAGRQAEAQLLRRRGRRAPCAAPPPRRRCRRRSGRRSRARRGVTPLAACAAVASRICSTASGFLTPAPTTSAATPATCGEAIEVPMK